MREAIIRVTVKMLDNFGIKFTIDDIKAELKISKKTIYKYFRSKEELAIEVFGYIIDKSRSEQKTILLSTDDNLTKLLLLFNEYMEIFRLQTDKIFNLYTLNSTLLDDIKIKVNDNWTEILQFYHCTQDDGTVRHFSDNVLRMVVEGIFYNICHQSDRTSIGYQYVKEVVQKC